MIYEAEQVKKQAKAKFFQFEMQYETRLMFNMLI